MFKNGFGRKDAIFIIVTQVANDTVLEDIMIKAANENTNGPYNKWTSTYFGGLARSITSINGTEQVCVEHLNSSQCNLYIFVRFRPRENIGRLVKDQEK